MLVRTLEGLLQVYRHEGWFDDPTAIKLLERLSFFQARQIMLSTNKARLQPSKRQEAIELRDGSRSVPRKRKTPYKQPDRSSDVHTDANAHHADFWDPQPTFGKTADQLSSIVEAISAVRTSMVECFQLRVLPLLRDRLPSTFALWKLDSQIRAQRVAVVEQSADLAEFLLRHDVAGRRAPWADFHTKRLLAEMKDWCSFAIRRRLIQDAADMSAPDMEPDMDTSSDAETEVGRPKSTTSRADEPCDDDDDDELADLEEVDIPVHPLSRAPSHANHDDDNEHGENWPGITATDLEGLAMRVVHGDSKDIADGHCSKGLMWDVTRDIPVSGSPVEARQLRTPSLSPSLSTHPHDDYALTYVPLIIDCELLELIPDLDDRGTAFQHFMRLQPICANLEDMDVTKTKLEDFEEQRQLEQAFVGLDRFTDIVKEGRAKSPLGISKEQEKARTRIANQADKDRKAADQAYMTSHTSRLDRERDAFRRTQKRSARERQSLSTRLTKSSVGAAFVSLPLTIKAKDVTAQTKKPSGLSRQLSVTELDPDAPAPQRPRLVRASSKSSVKSTSRPSAAGSADLFDESAMITKVDGSAQGSQNERAVRFAYGDENEDIDGPAAHAPMPPHSQSPFERYTIPRQPLASRDVSTLFQTGRSPANVVTENTLPMDLGLRSSPSPPPCESPVPSDDVVDMDIVTDDEDALGENASSPAWAAVIERY